MRWRLITMSLVFACCAGRTFAQTATPTSTPTSTPTQTPTSTPTVANLVGVMAYRATCASTPCDLENIIPTRGRRDVALGGGMKTVGVGVTAGTATVKVMCRAAADPHMPAVEIASLSGTSCDTASNCGVSFEGWCDELWLRITACSSCEVTGYLRQERN